MSIRMRLLINGVGVVVLFSLAFSLVIWFGWQRTLDTVAEALIGERMELTRSDLSEFAGPIEKQLFAAAQWGAEGLFSPDDPGQVEDLLQSLIQEYPWLTASTVINSRGRAFHVRRSGETWTSVTRDPVALGDRANWAEWTDDVPEKITYERTAEHDPRTESWFLGAIDLYNESMQSDEDLADRDLIYWTEPHVLRLVQRPGMIAAVAYESEDGVDHVVAFEVLLLAVHEFTSSIGATDGARAFVMTDDLQLMGLPRTEEAMTDQSVEGLLLKEPGQVGYALVDHATSALTEHVDSGQAVEFRSGEATWWGEIKAFTLPGSEHRLLMTVLIPEHSLTGRLRRQLQFVFILTLLGAALATRWAFRLSRSISRPIEALTRRGESLSRGDLEADLEVSSSLTEARRLGAALTHMRDSLRTLFQVERQLRASPDEADQDVSTLKGYDVAGWSEAADPGERSQSGQAVPHQIASVWDRFDLDGGERAIFFLADATGEGLESVFMATQARSMVRMAARLTSDLGILAATMNEQLYYDLPEGHFVSAWLGALDSGSSTLTQTSRGIQTLFHYRANQGQCGTIATDNQPLGVFSGAATQSATKLEMEPGDVFVVASDGVLSLGETPGTGLPGAELIARVLQEEHAGAAAEILDALKLALMESMPGAALHVDCSIIVVKRLDDSP